MRRKIGAVFLAVILLVSSVPVNVSAADPSYRVTYQLNGGMGNVPIDDKLYEAGDKAVLLDGAGLTREGYHFRGWRVGRTNGPYRVPGAMIDIEGDTNVYAWWSAVVSSRTQVDWSAPRLDRSAFMTEIGQHTQINLINATGAAWSSSDDSVAQVDDTGRVTATGNGDATVTATVGDGVLSCLVTVGYKAQNPMLPPSWQLYIPDGEPHVFDGVMYVYGSHDVQGGSCWSDYHVIYSEDAVHWTDAGYSFTSADLPAPYNTAINSLWAPDCVYYPPTQKYYLFLCGTDSDAEYFVAESDSPKGPFVNCRRIVYKNGTLDGQRIGNIDPGVFVDDDGTFWLAIAGVDGQQRSYSATYGSSRFRYGIFDVATATIDTNSIIDVHDQCTENGVTVPFEGPAITKFGDYYYYIYVADYKNPKPGIGYRTDVQPAMLDYLYTKDIRDGDSWKYGGTFLNVNDFPGIVNTHGSIEKMGDSYYVTYHTPMGVNNGARWTRIDRVNIDPVTGLIEPVVMTSSGVRPAFGLDERIQFSSVVDFSNGRWASTPFAAKTPTNDSRHQQLTMNTNNQYAGFRYVDFAADGPGRMDLNYRTTAGNARIRVTAGKPGDADTVVLAEMDLPSTGTSPAWHEISVPIPAAQRVTGVKTVYVQMLAAASVVFDWISFHSETVGAPIDLTFNVEPAAAADDAVITLQNANGVVQTPIGGLSYAVAPGTYYFVARSPLYVTKLGTVEVGEAAVSETIAFSELPPSSLTLRGLGTEHANGPNSSNRDMEIEGSGYVGWIRNPAWVKFGNTNLLGGIETASLNWARSGSGSATFHLLVAPSGSTGIDQATQIGSFTTSNANTGGWGNTNFTNSGEAVFNPVAAHSGGVQDLYVRFQAGEVNFGRLVLTLKPQPAGVKNYDITLSVRPYDAVVAVSKLDGTPIAPKEVGGKTYNVEEGFYRYTVSKAGYETETAVLPVTLSERKMIVLKPVGASYARYEAEEGLIANGGTVENAGFSQGRGAGGFSAYASFNSINATFTNTGSVRIAVERETTGIAELILAYNSSVTAENQDSVAVKANDSTTVRAWLNPSGKTSLFVDLRGGTNYIYVSSPTNPRVSNGGNAWIDYDYIDVLEATIPGSVDPAEGDEPYIQPNNPIVKSIFTADPEAHVWPTNPNKLYLYPSHDRYPSAGCDFMDQYHVYSTENMVDWVDEGEILRSSDLAWQTRTAPNANGMERSFMWAPDCAYNEETGYYYFYFPAPTNTGNWGSTWQTGVYRSKYPDRDFEPIPPEETYTKEVYGIDWPGYIYGAGDNFVHPDGSRNGTGIIDPAVRIFDGQAYLYIGGSQQHYEAKLMDDMVTIVPGSWTRINNSVTPAYHEGPSVFKKDDLYYLIYPGGGDASTGFAGDKFNYCTGPSPMGPWEYKGAFFNPTGCDTSHGSVVEFKGKWYWVYHTQDLSNNGTLRSVCIDELEFLPDGSIVRRSKSFDGPAQNGPDYVRPEPSQTISMGDAVLGGAAVLTADASAGYDHKVVTGFNVAGSTVTLNNIDGGENGGNRAMLVFHYSTPDDLPRLQLHINGKEYNHINFPKTGGRSFFSEITWTTQKLNPGPVNTIRLTSAQESGGRGKLNLAYVEVILFDDNVPPPGMDGLLTNISNDVAYGARYIPGENAKEGRMLIIAQYTADGRLISAVRAPQDDPNVLYVDRDAAAASAQAFIWDAACVPLENPLALR
jgi:beta-xylosidase